MSFSSFFVLRNPKLILALTQLSHQIPSASTARRDQGHTSLTALKRPLETPLILVEDPSRLIKNSLEGIFDQSTPILEHHPSLHWTTLLLFCLVVQAWNFDKKQRVLPSFPFTHVTFKHLLKSEAGKHNGHHAEERLEEIDERLCEVNYAAQSKRRDEARSKTIQDAFDTLDELLRVSQSVSYTISCH